MQQTYSIKEVCLTVREAPTIPVQLEQLEGKAYSSSEQIFRAFCAMNERDVEQFIVLHLDTKNQIRTLQVVSTGTMSASLVHPREVFRTAIINGAARIIVLHNHPSGDPEPSVEDIAMMERLKEAGKIIGVPLLDSLIVCQNRYVSFADRGIL
jgi:DNA repair protein RadC